MMTAPTATNGATLDCPAKLNLTLAAGPPRADGLHTIASVMVAMDFCDTLRLKSIANGPSRFDRLVATDAPRPFTIDWPTEQDLVYRAARAIEAEAGTDLPVDCVLTKRIPCGAGLGGGSSDAAGVLVGMRSLFDLPIDDKQLIALGLALGADVGFLVAAMLGQPAAVVTGIGDEIKPIPTLPAFHAVLVFPDGVCPTAGVYAAFDAGHHTNESRDLTALASNWLGIDTLPELFNDLADAAAHICPAVASAKATLASLDHKTHVTGSGAALFVLCGSREQAEQHAERIRRAGLAACASSFTPSRRCPLQSD